MRCASVNGSGKKPMRTRPAGLTKFSLLGIISGGDESHLPRRLFASTLGRIARLFLLEGAEAVAAGKSLQSYQGGSGV